MSSVTIALPNGVMRQPLGNAYPPDKRRGFSCDTRIEVTSGNSAGSQKDFAIRSVKDILKSIPRQLHRLNTVSFLFGYIASFNVLVVDYSLENSTLAVASY
jgi:hypothetical protein